MLCTATSCCCSPTALRKPSAWLPKPISPIAPSTSSPSAAPSSVRSRSRALGAPSSMNGSDRPAVTFTPTPATSVAAAEPKRGAVPAVSASAAESASRINVSLWAPPTASTSSTGFSPTKAAAQRRELPAAPRGARDQRDRAEARQHGERLECPQPAGQPERHEGVAEQREQRAVGGVLVGPAEERRRLRRSTPVPPRACRGRGRAARRVARSRCSRTRPGRSAAVRARGSRGLPPRLPRSRAGGSARAASSTSR